MSTNTRNRPQTTRTAHSHRAGRVRSRPRYRSLAFGVALALGALACGPAMAIPPTTSPTGGQVIGGKGSITHQGAQTIIHQQSRLLSLNWQTFNVGKDASVIFKQPSASAIALNRILDQNPSQIFGEVRSNGLIFLINTHGIIFGASARLNVGGLVASTLDLTPSNFLKQHFTLSANGGHAGIVNHGIIAAASGGSISLIGGHVVNDGLILANYGHINLDGADQVVLDFAGNGLINVRITGKLKQRFKDEKAAVVNKGTLQATSGTVVLKASAAEQLFTNLVNNTGVIKATGISSKGGVVRLVGTGGNVVTSGSINVSGTHGGSAQLLSDQNVGVMGGSINASGTNGGGSIRIGGGWQGGEGLPTAAVSYVAPDATLDADATQLGDGGSVVVWGLQGNNFYGHISARGGALGGNGGRVETSAHEGLNVQGQVDASAPFGEAGTWLLDPYNVTIKNLAGNPSFVNPFTATATSNIDSGVLGNTLTGGTDVTIFTNDATHGSDVGNITVDDDINADGTGALYLEAAGSIFVNADISAHSGDALGVHLWANYGASTVGTSYISGTCPNGCQVVLGGTGSAAISTNGGSIDIETGTGGGALTIGSTTTATTTAIDTGSGNLTINAAGTTIASKGTLALSGSGTVSMGSLTADGTFDMSGLGNDLTIVSLGGASTGIVNLGGNTLTLSNAADTFAGVIQGNGGFALTGGSEVLSGTTNTYKGGTTITNATLQVAGDGSLGDSNGAVTIDNGTLRAGANFNSARTIHIAGSSTAHIDTNGHAVTWNGAIEGLSSSQGILEKDGAGTLTLTSGGSGPYKTTNIDGGTLALTGTAKLGGKYFSVASGAIFDISQTTTGATVYTLNGAGTVNLGSKVLTIGAGNTPWTFSGILQDGGIGGGVGGSLVMNDNNVTGILTGNNTYTGGTTITNGTLQLGDNTASGSVAGDVMNNGALVFDHSSAYTYGGAVKGSGLLTQTGTGTLTLTGQNTYTGTTTIAAGSTLALSGVHNNVISASSVVANGTLDISGAAGSAYENIQSLSGSGAVVLGANALELLNASGTFSGVISGAGGFALFGGTETLSGSNLYGGETYVSNATLKVSADANLGTGSLRLNSGTLENTASFTLNRPVTIDSLGGTLQTDASTNLTVAMAITGSGPLTQNGSGTLTLDGDVTTTGATQTYNGTVALGNNVNLTGSTVTLNAVTGNSHNLTVTGNATLDGALSTVNDLSVTSGATTLNVASVTTVGTQNYGSLVLNGGDTTLIGTTVGMGAITGNGNALKVVGNANFNLTSTGLAGLSVTGGTAFGGNANLTSSGDQNYNGAVALNTGATLASTGGSVVFGGTVESMTPTAESLNVTASAGQVKFASAVGSINPLDDLMVSSQTLDVGNTLNVSSDLSLTTTGGPITQNAAWMVGLTSTFHAGSNAINLSNTGNDFAGVVNLTNSDNHAVYVDNGGNALTLGMLSLGSGALTLTDYGSTPLALTQDITTDGGTVTFGGAVTLHAPTISIDTTGGSAAGANVAFGGAVNGNSANNTLSVTAGTGAVNFAGSVGSSATPLWDLTTSSAAFSVTGALYVGNNLSIATTAGSIIQSAAWTVVGTSKFNAGSNAIQLVNGANSFGGQITITQAGTVELAAAGVLEIGAVNADSVKLDTASTLHDDITTTGSQWYVGAVTLDGSGNTLALHGNNIDFDATVDNLSSSTPQSLSVDGGNGLAYFAGAVGSLNGPLAALDVSSNTQSLFLDTVAAASVTVTGPVELFGNVTTSGSQQYNGAVSLGNDLILTTNTGGVSFAGTLDNLTTATPETLTIVASNGAVAITGAVGTLAGPLRGLDVTAATFSASGAMDIGGDLSITTTAGSITQGSRWDVTGNSTFNAGSYAVNLANANNDFTGTVTAIGTGVAISDGNDLTIAGLTDNNNGNVSLIAHGQLAGVGTINAGTGSITLTAGGAVLTTAALTGGDITLTGGAGISIGDDVNASGTLKLDSGGNITENTTKVITAGTLTGTSTGATHLDGDNGITTLGDFTANGFSLTNAGALTVGAGVTIDGGAGGTSLTANTGALAIDGTVGNSAGTTTLTAVTGAINEGANGVVRATTLSGSSSGDTTLDANGNAIATLGSFHAGNFTLVDDAALLVTGPLNATGDISLTTIGGTGNVLSVGHTLTGGTITLNSAGDLSVVHNVTAAAVNLVANGNLAIDAAVNSGTGVTTLTQSTAGGSISEGSGGSITAGTLTGSAQGSVALTAANAVASLGNFTAVGFSLTNAADLTVAAGSTVDGGARTTLTTTGAGSDLTVNGDVSGTAVSLLSSGAINEGANGVITAGTLSGSAANAVQLGGTNAIDKLGNFTASSLALTNGSTLTIKAGSTVDSGAKAKLDVDGDLAIDGTLKGSLTTLLVSGAISEGTAGVLIADTLTGSSTGSTILEGANAVTNLGDFTADGFSLTTDPALTVLAGDTVDGQSSTTLTTTGSGIDIAIDGTVKGDLVTLVASGAISEGANGMLQAGNLTGSSVGETHLPQTLLGELDAFSASNFSLSDAQALSVAGPLATTGNAGDISLTTTGSGHALTVNQAVQGAAITLASAGDLTVANAVTGTQVGLAANGNLAIDAAVSSGTGTTTLTQTGNGVISGGANGGITAGTLTGSAAGATTLGSDSQFMANHVDVLGGFSSTSGFSFTNDGTLTLASVGGSAFTVDAGTSSLYLGVQNGDLLENGTTWLYDGTGTWSSTGHIGMQTAPIYVTGVSAQTVALVGLPPAYFFGLDRSGNLLPFTGQGSVNVPRNALSSRAQDVNGHEGHYVDISAVTARYRPYALEQPGVLLPPGQWQCPPQSAFGWCPQDP